ncbi:MAG TPA: thiamine pyrophosphate-dependent enzyme [Dehalococcoidia bacterium]|nr:thiamine pyrophosphate-dependent enzyme [Dehalococcoidia bacterium]
MPYMKRDEFLEVLARHRGDAVVIPAWSPTREWLHLSPSDLNFSYIGSMGQWASVGLGLALAKPEKKVIVLDGDGSLLMNLGTLVTIAHAAPPNLVLMVLQNDAYEITGGQPIPGADRISFAGMALGAGFSRAYEFDDLARFEQDIGRVLRETGPTFVTVKAVKGKDLGRVPRRYPSMDEGVEAFKAAL